MTFTRSGVSPGNVGIGVLSPSQKLDIDGALRLQPLTAAPASPANGVMYYDNASNKFKCYQASAWTDCIGSGGGGGLSGSGTDTFLTKWTGASSLGDVTNIAQRSDGSLQIGQLGGTNNPMTLQYVSANNSAISFNSSYDPVSSNWRFLSAFWAGQLQWDGSQLTYRGSTGIGAGPGDPVTWGDVLSMRADAFGYGNVGIGTKDLTGARLTIAGFGASTIRMKPNKSVAGSVDLFGVVGNATLRTGTALCQWQDVQSLCLGYWDSSGTRQDCSTGSVANGRALCAGFGD